MCTGALTGAATFAGTGVLAVPGNFVAGAWAFAATAPPGVSVAKAADCAEVAIAGRVLGGAIVTAGGEMEGAAGTAAAATVSTAGMAFGETAEPDPT